MKTLKFALLASVAVAFCSFALFQNTKKDLGVSPQVYKKFLSKFEKVELPHVIGEDVPKTYEKLKKRENNYETSDAKKRLDREFGEIIPDISRGYYSRMGPDEYEAEVLLARTDKFDIIVYSRFPSFRSGKTYYVATFSKEGTEIARQVIASTNYNYSRIQKATIDKELNIKVEDFVTSDKFDVNNKGKIIYNLDKSKQFSISPAGNIIESKMQEVDKKEKQAQGGDMGMK